MITFLRHANYIPYAYANPSDEQKLRLHRHSVNQYNDGFHHADLMNLDGLLQARTWHDRGPCRHTEVNERKANGNGEDGI